MDDGVDVAGQVRGGDIKDVALDYGFRGALERRGAPTGERDDVMARSDVFTCLFVRFPTPVPVG